MLDAERPSASALCSRQLRRRLLRFGATGLLATGVHTLVALLWLTQVQPNPVTANGVAFVAATGVSFLANTLWSFSTSVRGANLLRYSVVNVLALGITLGISWLASAAGVGPLATIGVVALTMPPFSFLMHNNWTYRR